MAVTGPQVASSGRQTCAGSRRGLRVLRAASPTRQPFCTLVFRPKRVQWSSPHSRDGERDLSLMREAAKSRCKGVSTSEWEEFKTLVAK